MSPWKLVNVNIKRKKMEYNNLQFKWKKKLA